VSEEEVLSQSRALWNRTRLDLDSVEVIAQLLEYGTRDDWRALYSLAAERPSLRALIHEVVRTVALPFPSLWLAALESLGEAVDYDAPLPEPVEI
jgi:hypothetical protein